MSRWRRLRRESRRLPPGRVLEHRRSRRRNRPRRRPAPAAAPIVLGVVRSSADCAQPRRVGDDLAVEHLHLAGQAGGETGVVGDHDDRGALRAQLFQQLQQRCASGAVEVAGGLVGEQDRPDVRPVPWRSRRAGALPRRACSDESGRARRAPHGRAPRRRARGARRRRRRRRAGRRRRSPAPWSARPGRTAGRQSRCAWRAAWPARGRTAVRRRGP